MKLQPLSYQSNMEQYHQQAVDLLDAFRAGDSDVVRLFRAYHPRFLRSDIPWLPKELSEAEIRSAALELADAQLAVARWYDFRDWPALSEFVGEVTQEGSPVFQFETAVEAVVNGDMATLESLLRAHSDLVRARSTRVTHFDPPAHRATLLHYVAANGVEGHRQQTPANAVEIAKCLLKAGAEVDALA